MFEEEWWRSSEDSEESDEWSGINLPISNVESDSKPLIDELFKVDLFLFRLINWLDMV